MPIESFKDLTVWQRSMSVVKETYRLTRQLPDFELYGLTSQMRRAAVSIPSNIAEGKKRKTRKDYLMFLRFASGSAAELDTLLTIVQDVYQKVNIQPTASLLLEVQKMLTTMIQKLEIGS